MGKYVVETSYEPMRNDFGGIEVLIFREGKLTPYKEPGTSTESKDPSLEGIIAGIIDKRLESLLKKEREAIAKSPEAIKEEKV